MLSLENLAQGAKEKRLALDLENSPPRPSQPFDLDQELQVCASPSQLRICMQMHIDSFCAALISPILRAVMHMHSRHAC